MIHCSLVVHTQDFKEEKSPVAMSMSTPEATHLTRYSPTTYQPYRESPIGSYTKTATLGASPEVMDRRDWLNVLSRAGLSAHTLDLYTDNLRTFLGSVIKNLLMDFETTVDQLSAIIPSSVLLHEDSRLVIHDTNDNVDG